MPCVLNNLSKQIESNQIENHFRTKLVEWKVLPTQSLHNNRQNLTKIKFLILGWAKG